MISEKLKAKIEEFAPEHWQGGRIEIITKMIEAEIAERVAEAVKEKKGVFESTMKLNAALMKSLGAAHAKNAAAKHRPFDLEAAKRGEAIEWQDSPGEWHAVEFVGVWKESVLFSRDGHPPVEWPIGRIRMAPRPMRTVWVNVYGDFSGDVYSREDLARGEYERDQKYRVELDHVAIAFPVQVPAK